MGAASWRDRLRASSVIALAGLIFLTAACTSGGEDVGRSLEAAPADPSAVVEGFDPSVDARAAVGRINTAAREDPEALRAVAMENLDAADRDVRWAAVYALSLTASADDAAGIAALTEALTSSDVGERLNAAGGLAANGVEDALPVLIEMLGSDEQLRTVVFPAWRIAADLLLAYTEEDFGILDALDAGARGAAKARWETWWSERGGSLVWDPERRVFS